MRIAALAGLWCLLGMAAAMACDRWPADMARFAEEDAAGVPDRPIVFVGSSSIRLWESLAADMAPWPVVNRGFGGGTMDEVLACADRLIYGYAPQAVVVYAGENDLADGGAVEGVVAALDRLGADTAGAPPVLFLAIKTAPVRAQLAERFAAANAAVSDLAADRAWLAYVDTASPLRDVEGGIRAALYQADGLHLNADGYALWIPIVRAALRSALEPPAAP